MKHLVFICFFVGTMSVMATDFKLQKLPQAKFRNIIFILTDDHRFDAMGFMGHPFLETPHMDSLAKGGAHFTNAFVTTSLCSPSRASILTGRYAHNHGVVDNYNPLPKGLIFSAISAGKRLQYRLYR